jgi:hypothetical protein
VLVDERPFDLAGGLAQFAVTLDTALERAPAFLATPNHYARLGTAPDRSGGRSGLGGGSGGGGTRDRGLTDQQRKAIGFAGERFAFQWLQRVHGPTVTPECSVSEYRAKRLAVLEAHEREICKRIAKLQACPDIIHGKVDDRRHLVGGSADGLWAPPFTEGSSLQP